MQSESESYIPITEAQLAEFRERASALIKQIKFTPGRPARAKAHEGSPTGLSLVSSGPQEETQSLILIAQALSEDTMLLSVVSNYVMNCIREGVCIASHLVAQYVKASGLETLKELNSAGRLGEGQRQEFQNKTTTSAAIGTFVLASYVVWKLSQYEEDKVAAVKMIDVELPELSLVNSIKAIECVLFYLGVHLAKSGVVQTDIQMVKATILYFEAVVKDIQFKRKSLGFAELFTDLRYRLVDTKFTVQGFDLPAASVIVSQEFNRLTLDQIVGNREAKHEAKRMAQRLVCYDPAAKKNPFSVIGGLQSIRMGYGSPGTGKSMLISAEATLLDLYCKMIGLKFVFFPMPGSMVSSFQGGSEERAEQWLRRRRDPEVILYMPIDDAEDKFQNRSDQGVSEGVKGIISVFLRETEGASAPKFGNSVLTVFTNLPEMIDPAVVSRIQSRFRIEGAVDMDDFVAQDHLWWKKLHDVDPNFIGMRMPETNAWLTSQAEVKSLSQLMPANQFEVSDERVKAALAVADKHHDRNDHAFFGRLFQEIRRHYPKFTSREVRNIQTAVDARINDFDMPDEWFEKPDTFFRQHYDRKVDMLKELMKGNMKGLTFAEIRFQEAMRYLGTLAQMANIDRERKISAAVEQTQIMQEAARRVTAP